MVFLLIYLTKEGNIRLVNELLIFRAYRGLVNLKIRVLGCVIPEFETLKILITKD